MVVVFFLISKLYHLQNINFHYFILPLLNSYKLSLKLVHKLNSLCLYTSSSCIKINPIRVIYCSLPKRNVFNLWKKKKPFLIVLVHTLMKTLFDLLIPRDFTYEEEERYPLSLNIQIVLNVRILWQHYFPLFYDKDSPFTNLPIV